MEHLIKFYPVENGDCTLIKLDNGKTVVVDCQFLNDIYDQKGCQIRFDVKADLLKELAKDENGNPYVDLFISTHPHDDHCKGFEGNFYHGNPQNYDKKTNKDEIIIGELWVTPGGVGNELADSAETIRQEAKRRRKLYDDDNHYRGSYGNYLHIIGYNQQSSFDERYGYVPGTTVTSVNGAEMEWLELFIHAPFKEDVDASRKNKDKNATSIVVQYAFKVLDDQCNKIVKSRLLMAGDAEHEIWQHIIDNNKDDDKLKWNIFLAPHHCSWTFFNESSNKNEVKPSADTIMKRQIGTQSYVIASSKEIKNDDNNPPCYEAKKEYKSRLNTEDNFLNTATNDVRNNIPQPIVFKIDKHGKRLVVTTISSAETTVSRPAPRAGTEINETL